MSIISTLNRTHHTTVGIPLPIPQPRGKHTHAPSYIPSLDIAYRNENGHEMSRPIVVSLDHNYTKSRTTTTTTTAGGILAFFAPACAANIASTPEPDPTSSTLQDHRGGEGRDKVSKPIKRCCYQEFPVAHKQSHPRTSAVVLRKSVCLDPSNSYKTPTGLKRERRLFRMIGWPHLQEHYHSGRNMSNTTNKRRLGGCVFAHLEVLSTGEMPKTPSELKPTHVVLL